MIKPFSQACDNNAAPILTQLSRLMIHSKLVLEVGSGTGQHAVFFGKGLPHLEWQTSDLIANHEGISLWLGEAHLHNVLPPIEYDVDQNFTCDVQYDAVFTSNTLHILSWAQVEKYFCEVRRIINPNGLLIVYGPFNYNGNFTSESNLHFDQWLKSTCSERGLRDFEKVNALASDNDFTFEEDNAMPANNRLLVWRLNTQ